MKPTILVCWRNYRDDRKATGPRISLDAMMARMRGSANFKVIGEGPSHGGRNGWSEDELCARLEIPLNLSTLQRLRQVLIETDYDVLLLSSFFEPAFGGGTLLLSFLRLIPSRPIIVSPRGEFSPGALGLKSVKKRLFIAASRLMRFHRNCWMHATSAEEAEYIRAQRIPCRGILLAHDTSLPFNLPLHKPSPAGAPLRIALVARIVPIKNVDFAIKTVSQLEAPAVLDIYGPLEDRDYWALCLQLIGDLPSHVAVCYHGEILNAEVPTMLAAHDLFFLPTRGENFGHVIHEALMSGTPALISDQTPWKEMEVANAGWIIPLNDQKAFQRCIETFAALTPEERQIWRRGARAFAETRLRNQASIKETKAMFEIAIAGYLLEQ